MRNSELMETQAGSKGSPSPCLSMNPELPEFQAKNTPFLSNIPEIALTQLMGKAKTLTYVRKEVLDTEGYKANTVLIIFSGNVRIKCTDVWNQKEVTFQIQEPQSGFGKIALLPDELRENADVAVEKTVFAVILKSDFKNWLVKYPGLKFLSFWAIWGNKK
jgi:signal-transduction protein with cAMP-binding, CBS, and nucleotidyltransferase domain